MSLSSPVGMRAEICDSYKRGKIRIFVNYQVYLVCVGKIMCVSQEGSAIISNQNAGVSRLLIIIHDGLGVAHQSINQTIALLFSLRFHPTPLRATISPYFANFSLHHSIMKGLQKLIDWLTVRPPNFGPLPLCMT